MTKQFNFGASTFLPNRTNLRNQAEISTLPFIPHWAVRNGMVQTIVSSYTPKNVAWVNHVAQPILLDAGPDKTGHDLSQPVRLLAYHNSASNTGSNKTSNNKTSNNKTDCNRIDAAWHAIGHRSLNGEELILGAIPDDLPPVPEKGLVMTLHGWGGCSHSPYNTIMANALLRNGYDVVRLNLRDHGPGIHADPNALNKGVFYGTLMDEVAVATQRIAEMAGDRPFYIIGASMGGSFATRLALFHSTHSMLFNNLRRVVAICPSVNPSAAGKKIDQNLIFRRYFRNLWVRSLRTKEALFPELYDFSGIEKMPLISDITNRWVPEFSHHASADEYYAEYQVTREKVEALRVPTSIVAARDDAVIPYEDINALGPQPYLDLRIQRYGGHVGFVDIFPFRHCLPQIVLELLTT